MTTRLMFLDQQVRKAVVVVAGEDAVVSYLDTARWDAAKRTIVCRSPTGHSRLIERAGKTLSGIGVRIVLDASRFERLACPLVPMDQAA